MELPNELYHKPTFPHEFGSLSTFYPDTHKFQPYPSNVSDSQFYHIPMDNRFHYAPFNVITHGYPYEFQFQDFQYFVVIDFEATCDKERNLNPQEIIEFPSVIVSSITGQLEACFQTYVRPICNQHLSDFCKDLTGIQQIQVDRGVTLSEALLRLDKWLEKKGIKKRQLRCGDMVELGLSGNAGIRVPIQEDPEASLLQPVDQLKSSFL